MEKEQILNHVDSLTADQLNDFILKDKVTLDELMRTGDLAPQKRREIQTLLIEQEEADDAFWDKIQYSDDEFDFRRYITQFPAGKYIKSAKNQIEKIRHYKEQKEHEKDAILSKLDNGGNGYTPGMINEFLSKDLITLEDLRNRGIPDGVINRLHNATAPELSLGITPDAIPDGYTEVYFWGIPGSGKTCALGAILNTADRKGYLEIATGPGYDYTTRLKNIFDREFSILPSASPTETTQYLPFALRRGNEKPRSVSLIELSGEIFQCFYYLNANIPFPTESHEESFKTLLNFLEGNNRKIHFFFIDYNKENSAEQDDYKQSDYLQAAATFFNNNDVFKKTTDAIYMVVTKSDLIPGEKEQRISNSVSYLKDNYTSFINSIKEKCKKNGINGGKLTVEPFSLGKVYFQQICEFNDETSERIIDILMDRIKPQKRSILDVFNQ